MIVFQIAIAFGLMVFVHELGHFLVAKKTGVPIERFSIGFGPKLIGFKYGETEYRISAIPLGGYVKLLGEDPKENEEPDPMGFLTQPPLKRINVLLAGVTLNYLMALLIMPIVFMIGANLPVGFLPVIGSVKKESPAQKAGLKKGDKILSVDGEKVKSFNEMRTFVYYRPGEKITLQVKRDSKEFPVDIIVGSETVKGKIGLIGMSHPSKLIPVVGSVDKKSPAEKAGLKKGDEILSIDGQSIKFFKDISELIRPKAGKEVAIGVKRDGQELSLKIMVGRKIEEKKVGFLGINSFLDNSLVVGSVNKKSPAEKAGLREGDKILSLDWENIKTPDELTQMVYDRAGENIILDIKRGEKDLTLKMVVGIKVEKKEIGFIGISSASGFLPLVDNVYTGSPAEKAGLKKNDIILSIDGQKTETYNEVAKLIQPKAGKQITLNIKRDDKDLVLKIIPSENLKIGSIGVAPDSNYFKRKQQKHGVFRSISEGFKNVFLITGRTYAFLWYAITFQLDLDSVKSNMSGPVGIIKAMKNEASFGFAAFLNIVAVVSLNLAILNLLPIPVLDGGHILFAVIEGIRRKRISFKVQEIATYVGLSLILCLVFFVTYNDFSKQGWLTKLFGWVRSIF